MLSCKLFIALIKYTNKYLLLCIQCYSFSKQYYQQNKLINSRLFFFQT